ncbi:putative Zn(II)2Cys6 transcription factor [Aspergillus candidus]|uniref:Putative Zn(II)2Cys6 transcription factor n=1 Tax=Aspergillus candidus TaxID=41067 RepID=A0A2I2F1Q4_ASPCN|nr:putative Zn(II)2Cys6 transcription factor [Aspergillus candidus]PLB34564.1 putative Zn(II)2Cys6 transcription factor [Aspergillus candidus]
MNDHEPEREIRTEHSPSRFTAVNGRDSLVPVPPATATPAPNSEEHRNSSESSGRSRHDTPSRSEEQMLENGAARNDYEDHESRRSPSQYGSMVTNRSKRKRSESVDTETRLFNKGAKTTSSQAEDAPDTLTQPPSSNGPTLAHNDHEVKHAIHPSPSLHTRPDEGEDSRAAHANSPWQDYDTQLISQAQRAQQIDPSDAQLAEALQREAQGHEATQKSWGTMDRPVDGSAESEQSPPLAAFHQERAPGTVQVAPKRKRVFSNRTKTGCMTCRKRKKKCDEQHPACNNCIRGGFLCEGYSSRSTWQKPSSAKAPVPLQSKEGYTDITGQYVHDVGSGHERQQILAELETAKMKPIVIDENERAGSAQFNSSPTGAGSNCGSWSKRSWPNTAHSSYPSDHLAKSELREVPPIHELSRDGHPKTDYQIVPPIREFSHGPHGKPSVPLFQPGIDQRPAHTGAVDTSSPQAQARMALSIEHQLSTRTSSNEETEKDKMTLGELYRPFDIHLVEERQRCKAALWRFNNSCNPISGLSIKEQGRLLREVLGLLNGGVNSPSGVTPRSTGSIGQGAIVEAPFRCHYGYNIHIGEDTMISEECLFVDDCPINIGAHTWIGPRVTILTSMAHANMQERKGSQSRYQGRTVAIEEDCYVGAGCTIYPGVRLRRGAYVAPGEVVKSDIVAYGFQGLKPSYM